MICCVWACLEVFIRCVCVCVYRQTSSTPSPSYIEIMCGWRSDDMISISLRMWTMSCSSLIFSFRMDFIATWRHRRHFDQNNTSYILWDIYLGSFKINVDCSNIWLNLKQGRKVATPKITQQKDNHYLISELSNVDVYWKYWEYTMWYMSVSVQMCEPTPCCYIPSSNKLYISTTSSNLPPPVSYQDCMVTFDLIIWSCWQGSLMRHKGEVSSLLKLCNLLCSGVCEKNNLDVAPKWKLTLYSSELH